MEPSTPFQVETKTNPAAPLALTPMVAALNGWQTSECWFTVGIAVLMLLGAVEGLIPPEHAAGFTIFSTSLYKVLRYLLKARAMKLDSASLLGGALDLLPIPVAARDLSLHTPTTIRGAKAEVAPAPILPSPAAVALPSGAARGKEGEAGMSSPRTLAALALLTLFLAAAMAWLSGCASMTDAKRAQWSATGQWLLGKATDIALSTIVSAAQSQADAGAKADWMDSLATGLRTQATASFSSGDAKTLIGIWTPDQPHWQDLGAQLAAAAQQAAALPPEQRAEALARALELAAQAARAATASSTRPLVVTNGRAAR